MVRHWQSFIKTMRLTALKNLSWQNDEEEREVVLKSSKRGWRTHDNLDDQEEERLWSIGPPETFESVDPSEFDPVY